MRKSFIALSVLAGLLALTFGAIRFQWLLPYPSLDPFDDQWAMKTRWIQTAADTLEWETCGIRSHVFEREGYRVHYGHWMPDSLTVLGKSLEVPIGRFDTCVYDRLDDGAATAALLTEARAYEKLDAVLRAFDVRHLSSTPPGASAYDVERRYRHASGDTICFRLATDPPYKEVGGRVRMSWIGHRQLTDAYRERRRAFSWALKDPL